VDNDTDWKLDMASEWKSRAKKAAGIALDWKNRAEKAKADLYSLQALVSGSSALSGTSECAKCGVKKVLPYRRDDLGGYVCLTCVEQYLDATIGKLRDLEARFAKIDAEQAAMVSKADRCMNCAFGSRPCVLCRIRADKLQIEANLAEVTRIVEAAKRQEAAERVGAYLSDNEADRLEATMSYDISVVETNAAVRAMRAAQISRIKKEADKS
jgi:hypothetical protein